MMNQHTTDLIGTLLGFLVLAIVAYWLLDRFLHWLLGN